jgi:uroporphyrinogen-III synthase
VPTALVTRPREDSVAISEALTARGLDIWVEPMIEIAPKPGITLSFDNAQGIVATSANGVRALAAATPKRDISVWAVGEATAAMARNLGFAKVESAGGDVDSLAALIACRADPEDGKFIHVAGSHVAGDLAGRLSQSGFTLDRAVLYEARTAKELSPGLTALLDQGGLDLATFFSPRTAATFVTLVRTCGRESRCAGIAAYGLSGAVIGELSGLAWRSLSAAASPDLGALLAAIDRDLQPGVHHP